MVRPWDPENASELWGRGAYLGTSSGQAVGGSLDSGGAGEGEKAGRAPRRDASTAVVTSVTELARYAASERRWLREEILQIRADQNGYLSRSLVFTAGAIVFLLGLTSTLGPGTDSSLRLFLLPLLVTLPSWWLFFDRECSLCRIVGYLRVLDEIDSPGGSRSSVRFRFEGWERALSRFRDVQELSTPSRFSVWKRSFHLALADALLMRGVHRKLSIYWYSFALLSAVPLALAYPASRARLEFMIPAALVFVSGVYNLYLLGDLNGGRRSYDGAELMWTRILCGSPSSDRWSDDGAIEESACDDTAVDEVLAENSAPELEESGQGGPDRGGE